MSDITVGSVAVSVVPDARGFREKLSAQLRKMTADITINADIARLREQLAEATRTRPVTIEVDANTARAAAQIDEVARDRRATITTDVDRGALSAVSSSLGGISGMGAAVVALGPALVPVIAAVVGLAAALAAPLAFAGGGLTLFGLIAGVAVKQTKEQIKAIGDLSKKIQADQLAVTKASTPSGKKSAMAQLATDTAAYHAQLAALTPAQQRFMTAQTRLKESFHKLTSAAGGVIFGPLIKGMNLLSTILPRLKPAIKPISAAISTLLDDLAKATKGPGFKAFVKGFGTTAGKAIVAFGRIFGNVSKGLFHLFTAFGPASGGLVKSIGKMAKSFANFDFKHSKTFQSFLAFIRKEGPKVAQTFGDVFKALGKLSPVLAPLGDAVLVMVDAFAKFILKTPPKTLALIATAIGGIFLAIGAINPATILAVVAGLSFLASKSDVVKKAFKDLSGWVKKDLMPALRDAAKTILPALRSAFDSVKQSVKDNHGLFEALGPVLRDVGKFITKVLIPAMALFYSVELPALGKAVAIQITGLRLLGAAFVALALVGVVAFRALVGAAFTAFGAILAAADKGLGWIPGIGDKIHKARVGFDAFRTGSIKALDATAAQLLALQLTLDNLKPPKPLTVKVRLALEASNKTALALVGDTQKNKLAGMLAGRAAGGPVTAGTPYVVGEHRPELFVPETNGRIVPSVPTSGGHTGPLVNIEHMAPANYSEFAREIQARQRLAGLSGRRP